MPAASPEPTPLALPLPIPVKAAAASEGNLKVDFYFFGWGFASLDVCFPPHLVNKTRAWKDPKKSNILQSLEDA